MTSSGVRCVVVRTSNFKDVLSLKPRSLPGAGALSGTLIGRVATTRLTIM